MHVGVSMLYCIVWGMGENVCRGRIQKNQHQWQYVAVKKLHSLKLWYPLGRNHWRSCSFSPGGICIRSRNEGAGAKNCPNRLPSNSHPRLTCWLWSTHRLHLGVTNDANCADGFLVYWNWTCFAPWKYWPKPQWESSDPTDPFLGENCWFQGG